MKKSIFLFFAAILCAIGASAATKTIYFKSQQWWHKDNAASAAYYWGTGGEAKAWPGTRMTKVAGESDMWSIEIDTDKYQNIIFTRVNSSGAEEDWGAKTKDLVIPTEGNNFFTLSATEYWNGADGTWSTYTPPTPPRYITGTPSLVGGAGWQKTEVEMTGSNGKYTHTFTGLTKGTEYQFKITDGTWDNTWGASALNNISYYDVTGDNNIVLTPSQDGDLTVSFSNNIISLSGITAPKRYITGESLVGNWDGDAQLMNYANGKHTFTKTLAAGTYAFKVTDGTWNNSWGNGSQDYEFTTTEGEVTIEFDDTNKSIKVIVPEINYYITGNTDLVGGDGWKANEITMTETSGIYTYEFTNLAADKLYLMKVTNGSWSESYGHDALQNTDAKVENYGGNIAFYLSAAGNVNVTFDYDNKKITLTGSFAAIPNVKIYCVNTDGWETVYAYAWDGESKNAEYPGEDITSKTDGTVNGFNVHYVEFKLGKYANVIFGCGKDDCKTGDMTVADHVGKYYYSGTWYNSANDIPATPKYYITGNTDLVGGDGWQANEIEMTENNGVYTYTFEDLAAEKLYLMKVTNGSWSKNYGYTALDNTDSKVENYGENIAFYLSSVGDVSVSFTEEKITLTGSFAAIPNVKIYCVNTDGWETVYAYAWDGESKNAEYPGEDITSKTDGTVNGFNVHYVEFKLGKYANVIFGCGKDDCKTGDMTVADHVGKYYYSGTWYNSANDIPNPADIKCYLMGNGNANGVEMTPNPNNNNEYMLLDHYISAPFNFKYGEEVSDQVDNYDFPGIAWADGKITLPEGYYDFYFKKDIKKAYIAAVYLRDVTNTWGTICLPHASTSFSGAKFYEVSSLDPTKGLWLDEIEVGAQLVAGKPYVFEATASTIKVTYTDKAVATPVEGANGLTGTFTDIAAAEDGVLVGNYIIGGNKVHVATAQNDLPANRAYIDAALVPNKVQAKIPGRRRVCMGENATTGLDQIVAPEGQAVKAIVNGQLIIIRDGVKYNVQGQKL